MTFSDWIALAAAIFAGISGAAALIAYRLQRRTQATSDEQQVNDLIEKMEQLLGGLDNTRDMTLKVAAANNVALTSLRGQALEARKVIDRAKITPDWFQNMILAFAFSQTWDPKSAEPYLINAVDAASADSDHPAHVASLVARAQFYYNRSKSDDWDLARQDFQSAFDLLLDDPDQQGHDLAAQQAANLRLYQAGFELDAEGEAAAVPLIAEAFTRASTIRAEWRQRTVLKALGDLVRELQQTLGVPSLLQRVAGELSRADPSLSAFPAGAAAMLTAALTPVPPDGSLFDS